MSAHARLSFSASDRWLRCAASVNMCESLREDGESPAAAEGTRAHAALEKTLQWYLITGDCEVNLEDCDDEEMQEHVQGCANYITDRYEEMLEYDPETTMLIESKVDLHYMSNRDDMWGTADVIVMNTQEIDVMDLKYGRGIFVEADSPQLKLYGLGAMAGYQKRTGGDCPWDNVRTTVLQPRYPDPDGNDVRYEDWTPDELQEWFNNAVLPQAQLTDTTGITPVPGDKQCRWCLAKATCPAAKNQMEVFLGDIFQPFEGDKLVGAENKHVDDMDVDALMQVHNNIPFIEGYLKAVNARLRTLLEARDPRVVGKLKLVVARRTNQWTEDDEDIIAALTKGKGFIPKKQLVREKLLTAPQALKLKLKDAQKARLQEYIEKKDGNLSIVPASDPREDAYPPMPFESVTDDTSGSIDDFL